ncbi:MAG: long-chain fatty acid--CoA ligase, partial [Candidatus Methylomirabilales bacterium]
MGEPLIQRVLEFIREPKHEAFGLLALEVFAFQYRQNPAYRQFCDRRGITPETVDGWQAIPAVPTSAFKVL